MRYPIIMLSAACVAASPAMAQQGCSDILRDGTFQSSNYRENSFFKQIIYSRFLSSSFQQSKRDQSLGFGVPVGEIVLGGNYTEAQFNQKKQDVRRELSNQVVASNEVHTALASGDPTIVNAWTQCMAQAGGQLALRFEAVSPTEAFGEIAWYPGRAGEFTGVETTVLDEDIYLIEGVTIVQGSACIKAGRVISRNACRFTVKLPDARTTIAVAVNAQHGSAKAYLPPRLKFVRDVAPYQFNASDRLEEKFQRGQGTPSRTIQLSAVQIAQGWRLDPKTAAAPIEIVHLGRWVHSCTARPIEVHFYSLTYSYHGIGVDRNPPDRNTSITCRVNPRIQMVRERWIDAT